MLIAGKYSDPDITVRCIYSRPWQVYIAGLTFSYHFSILNLDQPVR